MAIGNMDLYRSLKEAGASDKAAIQAAKAVVSQMPPVWVLNGLLATVTALMMASVLVQMHILHRLNALEERLAAFEHRLSTVDSRLDGLEARVASVEGRITRQLADIMQQVEFLMHERTGQ
jgi:hypothetical protein